MPKMKRNSSAKKRFKLLKSGKVKYTKSFRRHLLTKKSAKRKRNLRKSAHISSVDVANIKRLLCA